MRDDKVKILFIWTVNSGVAYQRMICFAKKIGELGLAHCRVFPEWHPDIYGSPNWERNLDDNIYELEAQIKWADIVICQYVDSPEGFSFIEAVKDLKPCCMEIDDYLPQVPHQFPIYDQGNKPGDSQHLWSTRQAITSNGIITTTPYLANNLKSYNSNVLIIPNCIDFEIYDQFKSDTNKYLRIGWIGGATHGLDLELIKDVIFEVLNKYKNTEVLIISCPPPIDWPKHERLRPINNWASIDKYPKYLKEISFDIGLSPLRDNYFNRAKSNLRYLEYSACRIPTVASNVEPFKMDFEGFACNTDQEWIDSLSKLIEDEDLRLRMGSYAYYHVKEHFNLNNIAIKYYNMVKEQLEWHGQIFQRQVQAGGI